MARMDGDDMSICFIPAGDITNAGSRMRAYWPAEFIPGATVAGWDDIRAGRLPQADAYVFQKLVDVALMQRLRDDGAIIVWDVCDPAWWFNPNDAEEAADAAHAVVASSRSLADDFTEWNGRSARYIRDRVLLSHFSRQVEHRDTSPVRLIWFGAGQNRVALHAAAANLSRLRANGHAVTLTIFDDAPHVPVGYLESDMPIHYVRWALHQENEVLAAHDIALLPPYPGPWGAVKSNNKAITAMAAGLPVTDGTCYQELWRFVTSPSTRAENGRAGRILVEELYNVEQSAADWTALIEELQHGANDTVHRGTEGVQVRRQMAQAG